MEIQRRKVGTSFPLESRRCMCMNRFHSPKYMNIQLFPVGWDFINLATPTKQDTIYLSTKDGEYWNQNVFNTMLPMIDSCYSLSSV